MATRVCTESSTPAYHSFTFPLSHLEETSRISPFVVRKADQERLQSSEAFRSVRELLAIQQGANFCDFHQPSTPSEKETWILHRDITHALVLPILHIYRRASTLAQTVLCARSIYDQELAFRGEARGAFSWLQCLILEEAGWCTTKACPACVTTHVLQSEPTIRLVLVACRLSRSLRPATPNTTSLPMFDFWRSCLRRAVDRDPFWGPQYAKDIEERAERLEPGVRELLRQCSVLSDVVARNVAKSRHDVDAPTLKTQALSATEELTAACPTPHHRHDEVGVRRTKSILCIDETDSNEQSWMQKIFMGCWTSLMAEVEAVQLVG